MELTRTVDEILADAADTKGEELQYDYEQIQASVKLESASVYEGLGIRILSIVGGFLACGFLLAFIGITNFWQSESAMMILGLLFLGGTIAATRFVENRFMDGASIAMFFSGLILLAAGASFNPGQIVAYFVVVSLLTFFLVNNKLLMFLSVLLFWGAILWKLHDTPVYLLLYVVLFLIAMSYTLVSLSEGAFITAGSIFNTKYTSLRAGLLFSFIGLLILMMQYDVYRYLLGHSWISWCIIMTAIFITIYHITQEAELSTKNSVLSYAGTTLLMLPALFTAAVPGAVLILLLSVHTRNRTGFVSGILAFIYFVSRYYYDMNQTLLVKSIILLAAGFLFIAVWYVLKKHQPNEEL